MAREPKRDSIQVDDHIWGDEAVRALTKPAQLGFIYLTAWSKAMRKDGYFSQLALGMCNVTDEELAELLEAGFVTRAESGYFIPKWSEWQVTEAERKVKSEVARTNGALGGAAKRDNVAAVNKIVTDTKITAEDESRLRELYGLWYECKPLTKDGGRLQERLATFFEKVAEVRPDIEKFSEAVMWRLQAFELDRDPDKHRFLGTIGNFLKNGVWLDQTKPREIVGVSGEPDPGFES